MREVSTNRERSFLFFMAERSYVVSKLYIKNFYYLLPIDYRLLHKAKITIYILTIIYRRKQWKKFAQYEGPAKNLRICLDHFERQYIKKMTPSPKRLLVRLELCQLYFEQVELPRFCWMKMNRKLLNLNDLL